MVCKVSLREKTESVDIMCYLHGNDRIVENSVPQGVLLMGSPANAEYNPNKIVTDKTRTCAPPSLVLTNIN
jgi:hypothetical protein